jgi:hypothetical protein
MESGTVLLKNKQSDKVTTETVFVRATSLSEHVEHHFKTQLERNNIDFKGDFNNELWVKFGGDKGGTSTKLAVEIANVKNSNSAENTELIACYEATDSRDNMQKVFGMYSEQFINLDNAKIMSADEDGERQHKINKFLFGDYCFLCNVLGHQGASAKYPCIWCIVPLDRLRARDGKPHTPKLFNNQSKQFDVNEDCNFDKRTIDMYRCDLASCTLDPRNNGEPTKNGKYHHSVIHDMLFPVSGLDQVVPLPLHICLGLGHDFFQLLESECRSIDKSEKHSEILETIAKCKIEVTDLENKFRENQTQLKALKQCKSSRFCNAAICTLSGQKHCDVGWIQCDKCDRWVHQNCVQLNQAEACAALLYECDCCKGITLQKLTALKEAELGENSKILSERKHDLAQGKIELDTLDSENEESSDMGPLELSLNKILENDLNIHRQAYHSNCFVGNHIHKIVAIQPHKNLNNPKLLVSVLEDHAERQEKFYSLFEQFSTIHNLISKAKFLTINEIETLCHSCWSFGQWYPLNFPLSTITPKFHILTFHIPEFVQQWHTVGLLSEHGLESLHSVINIDKKTYSAVRNKCQQAELIFKNHNLRASVDLKRLSKPKRKCVICSKGFYKSEKHTTDRKCQKCGSLAPES